MLSVYVTPRGCHFHSGPDCRRIRCGQRARGSSGAREVPMDEVVNLSPCRTCFPDAPRAKSFHAYCEICSSLHPCQHNGGVLVEVTRTWHNGSSLLLSPGEKTTSTRYVWPEHAHRFTLVT